LRGAAALRRHQPFKTFDMGSLDQAIRHRLTVREYRRMGEVGIFAPDARVELIDGEVIDMAPIGSRHMGAVNKLNRTLVLAVGERGVVQIQGPVQLGDRSEPEPDVAVLKPRPDAYADSTALADHVLLLIEVADSSLELDRSVKVPLYAAHAIPEVWIVDVANRLLTIHREPRDGLYRDVQTMATAGIVEPVMLPGVRVDLGGLF